MLNYLCANFGCEDVRMKTLIHYVYARKYYPTTIYWLILCKEAKNYASCSDLIEALGIIQRLIGKIISLVKKPY